MVVYGQVVNNTYCNFTRECGMSQQGESAQPSLAEDLLDEQPSLLPSASLAEGESPDLEPLVGNALMMVYVHPKVQNRILSPDTSVTTARATELRLGPGTNYAAFTSLPAGATGKALGMLYDDLNGVLATGAYWQRVKFDDFSGWMRQDALYFEPPPEWPRTFLPLIRR
jgi:hypothetical protein